MQWRFTILDRDNEETIIEEPEGWDGMKINVKRDLEKHGIFFDYQGNDFIFRGVKMPVDGVFDGIFTPPYSEGTPGAAYGIIRNEYKTYGVEGNLVLIISQDCGYGYEELYRGKLLFSQYKEYCGDDCYCKIPIELTGDVMTLKNRWDQEVDLESLVSYDRFTGLEPYTWLGKEIELKSKRILLQDKSSLTESKTLLVKLSDIGYFLPPSTPDTRYAWFNMVMPTNELTLSEFGNFNPATDLSNTFIGYGTYDAAKYPELRYIFEGTNADSSTAPVPPPFYSSVYFDWATTQSLMYFNPDNANNLDFIPFFDLHVSFQYDLGIKDSSVFAWHHAIVKRKTDGNLEILDNDIQYNISTSGFSGWGANSDRTLSYDKTLSGISLEKGEYLYIVVAGLIRFWSDDLETKDAFEVNITSASIEATALSQSAPTTCKAFLVNEAMSRIAESITDDRIRVYSDYFGRKDAKPYESAADGCGSLEAITKGLFIRGITQKNDERVDFSLSLKNMWDGLNPIHHIGCGIEDDYRRPGYRWMRVEPWRYFYQTNIIMECGGVNEITREAQENEHYSTFVFGYEKWEAEEFNGLDEFLTKRKYRTTLSEVQNELSQLSKMVTSGYALEITKRKGNIDSKDWRFDNDTFLICLKRGLPAVAPQQYLVKFMHLVIELVGVTDDPVWAVIGSSFTVSGSTSNNKTFTITNKYTAAGNYYIGVSPFPVSQPTAETVTISPIADANALTVELGGITDPENIIDPDTIYNFRLSPIRNAMRWADKVFASYRNVDDSSQLIFTSGEGNYFAKGLMSGSCVIELASMMENESIDITKFSDSSVALPLMRPERISFQYPLTLKEFKNILAHPYGVIAIVDSCTIDAGWIDEINYTPSEGLATFKLMPAYPNADFILSQGIFAGAFGQQME